MRLRGTLTALPREQPPPPVGCAAGAPLPIRRRRLVPSPVSSAACGRHRLPPPLACSAPPQWFVGRGRPPPSSAPRPRAAHAPAPGEGRLLLSPPRHAGHGGWSAGANRPRPALVVALRGGETSPPRRRRILPQGYSRMRVRCGDWRRCRRRSAGGAAVVGVEARH